jgi:hypothetical protein
MMQEWKFGVEGKASVCKGIWWEWIGKRPAIKGVEKRCRLCGAMGNKGLL